MSRKRPLFGVDPELEAEIDRAFAMAAKSSIPTRDILVEQKVEMPNVFAEIDAKNQLSKMAREENAKVTSDKHQVLLSMDSRNAQGSQSATVPSTKSLPVPTNTSLLTKPTKVSFLRKNGPVGPQ